MYISHPDYDTESVPHGNVGDILLTPKVCIMVGMNLTDVLPILKHHGHYITSKLDLSSEGDRGYETIYWQFTLPAVVMPYDTRVIPYDSIISLSSKDGKVVGMSYWTKKDFTIDMKHRAKTEQGVTALKFDAGTYQVSVQKAKR